MCISCTSVVGVCFYNGTGVPRDYPEAFRLFNLSAGLGSADAQGNLGKALLSYFLLWYTFVFDFFFECPCRFLLQDCATGTGRGSQRIFLKRRDTTSWPLTKDMSGPKSNYPRVHKVRTAAVHYKGSLT